MTQERGLFYVLTGNGAGKTTCAVGHMLRAYGHGWSPALVQFYKHANNHFGETVALRKLSLPVVGHGLGFAGGPNQRVTDAEIKASAEATWEQAEGLLVSGTAALVVLDEISYPILDFYLDSGLVWRGIDQALARHVHVIATGRHMPELLLGKADLATYFQKVRHPYDQGRLALRGMDF